MEQKALDQRAAMICAVIANCHRDPKKRAYKIEDFMPQRETKKKTLKDMKPQELIQYLTLMNTAMGGQVVTNQLGVENDITRRRTTKARSRPERP